MQALVFYFHHQRLRVPHIHDAELFFFCHYSDRVGLNINGIDMQIYGFVSFLDSLRVGAYANIHSTICGIYSRQKTMSCWPGLSR